MRSATSNQQALLGSASPLMVWFVELGFSTVKRLCSSAHALDWNGNTWNGVGDFVSLEPIIESDTMAATGYRLTVTLTSSALVSLALSEKVQGDTAKFWLGIFNPDGSMEGTPIPLDVGVCDQIEINYDKGACQFSLTIESEMADWDRPKPFRYTNEDQQARFPGDKFFEYTAQITEKALAFPSREVLRA